MVDGDVGVAFDGLDREARTAEREGGVEFLMFGCVVVTLASV